MNTSYFKICLKQKIIQKKLLLGLFFILNFSSVFGQTMGLSFAYFLPRNGEFSTPISPFSIRGVGAEINRHVSLQTGISLYRMSGLNVINLPFKSFSALTGPNFTIFIPGEIFFQWRGKKMKFSLKAGGFFFYSFDQQLNYGHLDRSLRAYKNWDVANASFSFQNKPGIGLLAGFEFTANVTSKWGVVLETNILNGYAHFPLTGSYTGGNMGGNITTIQADFKNSKIDFTGIEISLGVVFNTRN